MFKELKENIFKYLKTNMASIIEQMRNPNKEMQAITKIEILELKITITEITRLVQQHVRDGGRKKQ